MESSAQGGEDLRNPAWRLDARHIGGLLCLGLPLALWLSPLALERNVKIVFCIALFMLVAWMFRVMEYAVTGLIGCLAFCILGGVKFRDAFSGFGGEIAWFTVGALLIGLVATKTGVSQRLSRFVMMRCGLTYPRILFGLVVTDLLLTFIVPSGTARVAIVASIALGLVETLKVQKGSNIGRGMFIVLTYTATLFDKMIIAGAASVTARGLIESAGGVNILWSQWLITFLPGNLITVVAAWWVALRLWPPEKMSITSDDFGRTINVAASRTSLEIKGTILIGLAVLLWVTDFIHHISPAQVALGIGLLALVPGIGVLDADDLRRLNYLPVFFLAAAVSLAEILDKTGALPALTKSLFQAIEPYMTHTLVMSTILYWTAFIYHFFWASEISMLATSLPLLMSFAKTHGLSPQMIGLVWTYAAGGKIFAYQNAVLVLGYSYGYFQGRDLIRFGLIMTVVEFGVLLGLISFYWPLIGIH